MSAASLSLLKGGKKAAVEEELETAQVEEEASGEAAEAEETTVEVDNMTSKELDALVKEYGIETPALWNKWNADAKRAWLKEQFDEDGGSAEAEAETPVEEAAAPAETVAEETPTEAPKTTTKKAGTKKAAGKAVAKSMVKTGEVEVQGEDVLSDLIHEIETMKEKEARELVGTLTEQTEITFFKLGGVLSVIQSNGWYEPYASFREYVEKEHGIEYRRAVYWTAIYNALAESKVPWAKVKIVPWTKLKEIAKVLTLDNVDEWVKIASEQNTITLIETVKNFLNKDKAIEDNTPKAVTTKTFKVHEGQKEVIEAAIDKAKEQGGTVVDTVALEYICSDFLGSQTMVQKLQKMGIEAALGALEKAYPNAKIDVEITEEAA